MVQIINFAKQDVGADLPSVTTSYEELLAEMEKRDVDCPHVMNYEGNFTEMVIELKVTKGKKRLIASLIMLKCDGGIKVGVSGIGLIDRSDLIRITQVVLALNDSAEAFVVRLWKQLTMVSRWYCRLLATLWILLQALKRSGLYSPTFVKDPFSGHLSFCPFCFPQYWQLSGFGCSAVYP